jgi:hypothetical protein
MVETVFLRSISGNYANINTSGQVAVDASVTATANISGQTVVLGSGSFAPLSGLFVNASVTANISGQTVYTASGFNNVREVGSSIFNSTLSGANVITGNSGGLALFSGGPLLSAMLRSFSGNGLIFVGAPGSVSNGVGMPVYANESVTLKVSNFNAIGAFATTSGQQMSYIGLL